MLFFLFYDMEFLNAYHNEKQFLSLTSLMPEEFDVLLKHFRPIWYKFYRTHTLTGKRRTSVFNHYRKTTRTLPTVEDKLFFLLVYIKTNPLQEFQAFTFGLSQSRVSRWINVLMPLVQKALKQLKCLPCRDGSVLRQVLQDFDIGVVTHDGMEQTIGRQTDDPAQQKEYSGKKKDHTYKNKVDCLDSQYVPFLSYTYYGSTHDKTIADEEQCTYPDNIRLRQDTGFQGYAPDNVHIVQPFKKPKNGLLEKMQKWFNSYVGARRIVVEHAIRGIKRCRIIKERCRVSYRKRDQFVYLATALHNFRVCSPIRKYDHPVIFMLARARAPL